jgi:hypothetical protein
MTTTLHPWGCRCSGLDRLCENRRRANTILGEGLDSTDPAFRALSEAAVAALVNGRPEAGQSLRAVMKMAEGVTLGEAMQAAAVLSVDDLLRERKAAVRERWAAVVGRRVPGSAGDIGL